MSAYILLYIMFDIHIYFTFIYMHTYVFVAFTLSLCLLFLFFIYFLPIYIHLIFLLSLSPSPLSCCTVSHFNARLQFALSLFIKNSKRIVAVIASYNGILHIFILLTFPWLHFAHTLNFLVTDTVKQASLMLARRAFSS